MPEEPKRPPERSGAEIAHRIGAVNAAAYTVPTERPESDGTFEWDSTTIVIVEISSGDVTGIGYTYASPAATIVIREHLARVIIGRDAMATDDAWDAMIHQVRNIGRPGIASSAIAAADIAMWDLRAKLLGIPLARLLDSNRESVPVYGSGGFTSYSIPELESQLAGWVEQGIPRVKMKVGRDPGMDVIRVRAARGAIGESAELFVDANAAYDVQLAGSLSAVFKESRITLFEEPVSSENFSGLRQLRTQAPEEMEIAAGEYGSGLGYFRRMLEANVVDVMQADATRCAGISEFLRVGTLCSIYGLPLSADAAPALHMHLGCAVPSVRHVEYFHDHVRIERMFFDGVSEPRQGSLFPDLSRPGLGIELKRADAEPFRVM
jgi:L-alanine-DL-glutamate epimerase-like enolase superfamily enzyme